MNKNYKEYLEKLGKTKVLAIKTSYKNFLKNNRDVHKIPFLEAFQDLTDVISVTYGTTSADLIEFPKDTQRHVEHLIREIFTPTWDVLRYISLKYYEKTKEKTIQIYQRGMPIKTAGRLRGNMEYLEDRWRVQIQPITFKYAFLDYKTDNLMFTDSSQAKLRDKYLKVRVRYDGKKYVMVNAIKTKYTVSYV